ncbi:transposase, partial [Bradyrhizobium sp. Arg237L]|uniref:transposase n=1 Tax=Bradyrhizobium sp. Arg237L TaxID=3003352 RepID=UPI00249EA604
ESRYVSRKAVCDGCSLRGRCVEKGSQTRTIYRWVHEDVIERHQARMRNADSPMRRRGSLVEHPFGTLKCRAGYRHFLVRGLDKVRGEWSLMVLCYNFSRLLNILGFDGFVACLASRQAASLASICILRAVAAIAGLATVLIGDFRRRL